MARGVCGRGEGSVWAGRGECVDVVRGVYGRGEESVWVAST